jgi:acid phosphatase type 7
MRSRVVRLGLAGLTLAVLVVVGIVVANRLKHTSQGSAATAPGVEGAGEVTVVAAGDIASCSSSGDDETADLVEDVDPDAVLALGDNVYQSGTLQQYRRCYDATWGRFKAKTYPVPGNHDYETEGAAGYLAYFGERAGAPGKTYYSFDLGAWHVVALDTNIDVGAESAQLRWLRSDLEGDDHVCELAFFHHPRWSGGRHDSQQFVDPLWRLLADEGVDVVLAGHDHNYQRFYKLDAAGRRAEDGIRSFVVGTGGGDRYDTEDVANRAAASDDVWGVLELTLLPRGYDFEFLPAGDSDFTDSLQGRRCH